MKHLTTIKIYSLLLILGVLFTINVEACDNHSLKQAKIKTNAHCSGCQGKIESGLKNHDGVESTSLNLESKVVTVSYNPAKTSESKINNAISKLGYETELVKASSSCCSTTSKVSDSKSCCTSGKKVTDTKSCCTEDAGTKTKTTSTKRASK